MKDCNIVVDGGGTKTEAVVIYENQEYHGFSTSSNIFTLSIEGALDAVREAIGEALNEAQIKFDHDFRDLSIKSVIVALAGALSIDQTKYDCTLQELKELFSSSCQVKFMSDLFLLPMAIEKKSCKYCITLIAGTGSSSLLLQIDSDIKLVSRSGGWGSQFGDDGGGYGIGRDLIRSTLKAIDEYNIMGKSMLSIHIRVFETITNSQFNTNNSGQFLVCLNHLGSLGESRKKVASLASIIFQELEAKDGSQAIAEDIIQCHAQAVGDIILPFVDVVELQECMLVVSGSLFKTDYYYKALIGYLYAQDIRFGGIKKVFEPAKVVSERLKLENRG